MSYLQVQVLTAIPSKFIVNQLLNITELFALAGTFKGCLVQFSCNGQRYLQLDKVALTRP